MSIGNVVVVGEVGDSACIIFAVVFGWLPLAVPVGFSVVVDWIVGIE